jgi:phytoene synthase
VTSLDRATLKALRAAAGEEEPDRAIAALAAGTAAVDLMALAAFGAELRRAVRIATEPLRGELRMQWWRESLATLDRGERTGHPVADALGASMRRHVLPRDQLLAVIEYHSGELYDDEIIKVDDAMGQHAAGEGAMFALALRCLDVVGAEADALARDAGALYGMSRMLVTLPLALARGRLPLPRDVVDDTGVDVAALRRGETREETRLLLRRLAGHIEATLDATIQHARDMPRRARPGFAPLAMVRPNLASLSDPRRDPLRDVGQSSVLSRLWRVTRAAKFGL